MKTEYLNVITLRENHEREDTIDSFLEFLMDMSGTKCVHRLSITPYGGKYGPEMHHLIFTIRLWGTSQFIQYNYIFNGKESENFSKNFAAIAVAHGNCNQKEYSPYSIGKFLRMEEEE